MPFVPASDKDREYMLSKIGVQNFEQLIENIPSEVRYRGGMDFPEQLSEYEVTRLMLSYSNMNNSASSHICFMGGGAYERYIPSIVGDTINRAEFRTAYTPYQAEVSQGTLQAMYEFQTMICELYGMDVANASMYDGGTALAEAVLMSTAINRKTEFVYVGTINPNYKDVVKTITQGRKFTYLDAVAADGTTDFEKLKSLLSDKTSAVVVQQPNFLGSIEDVREIEKLAHANGSLFIVAADPFSVGVLEAPGNYNADIVIAEGQPLGIPLSYGGPYLGIFACKQEFVRKIPGRLAGVTSDLDGKRGFVLTLQTREQQIKREKATSNICTNQGLFMLAATVYLETMGKAGVKEVAEQSFHKAHYLAERITELDGYELFNDKPFVFEFAVNVPGDIEVLLDQANEAGFLAGINVSKHVNSPNTLLITVTETRTKKEMDDFVDFLKQFK
ncbi:MAG: aminomethyl-transferring glycine dehydrogenase subunit GcvPA [Candidatus Kapaibacterium sp.]